jgi:hypothetical protein
VSFKLEPIPLVEGPLQWPTNCNNIGDVLRDNDTVRYIVKYLLVESANHDQQTPFKTENDTITVAFKNKKQLSVNEIYENIIFQRDLLSDGEFTNNNSKFLIVKSNQAVTRFDIIEESIVVEPANETDFAEILPKDTQTAAQTNDTASLVSVAPVTEGPVDYLPITADVGKLMNEFLPQNQTESINTNPLNNKYTQLVAVHPHVVHNGGLKINNNTLVNKSTLEHSVSRYDLAYVKEFMGLGKNTTNVLVINSTTAESAPVETTTAESAPVETTTAESAPVETTTAESAPVETTTAESAPVETTTDSALPTENVHNCTIN